MLKIFWKKLKKSKIWIPFAILGSAIIAYFTLKRIIRGRQVPEIKSEGAVFKINPENKDSIYVYDGPRVVEVDLKPLGLKSKEIVAVGIINKDEDGEYVEVVANNNHIDRRALMRDSSSK